MEAYQLHGSDAFEGSDAPRGRGGSDREAQRGGPAGYGPPIGGLSTPPFDPVDAPKVPSGPPRARTLLVALVAFLVELVLVAAGGNQWVTNRIVNYRDGHILTALQRDLINSGLTYNWRFSPSGGHDPGHFWLGQLALVVAFLIVSALLIAVVAGGAVTFWRAFFGVWGVVLGATIAGAVARGAIIDPRAAGGTSNDRAVGALFGSAGPTTTVVVAGLIMGLAIGLVTAIVAVATRRRPMVAATSLPSSSDPFQPDAPPPFYGDPAGSAHADNEYGGPTGPLLTDAGRPWDRPRDDRPPFAAAGGDPFGQTTAFERQVPADQPVDAPVGGSPETDRTTQLPVVDDAPGGAAHPADADSSATSQLPVVEDAPATHADPADGTDSGATSQLPTVDAPAEPAAAGIPTATGEAPTSEPATSEQPTSELRTAETPATATSATDTPTADTPTAETPATDTPTAETPTAETPTAETPTAEPTPAAAPGSRGPSAPSVFDLPTGPSAGLTGPASAPSSEAPSTSGTPSTQGSASEAPPSAATQQIPTTQFRPIPPLTPPASTPTAPPAEPQATQAFPAHADPFEPPATRFPRPPDDEDLPDAD